LYDGRYRRIPASSQTIELLPVGAQTRLILTEQLAIVDGLTRLRLASMAWGAADR
jgi:hypothetical protein